MKKGLLGSTALIAATALTAGVAQAQQGPTASFSGFMNFQIYIPSGDIEGFTGGSISTNPATVTAPQDGTMYFGVDDAELALNVKGTADNGLDYGFKIEFEGSPGGSNVADEARIQLGGSWGTLQLGDEDGAEDTMNYGAENLMGATGGWDGDGDDVMGSFANPFFPTIIGDTSDNTKITYYSPRFSGIQVGVSYTPSANNGNALKVDTDFENSINVGANYDGSFGNVRVRVSGVYTSASSNIVGVEDIGAYSIGAIVGFGPVQVGANWTDNSDSGYGVGSGADDTYWNVGVGFETGPLYLSAGYISHTLELTGSPDGEATAYALSADYTVAPGMTAYAEWTSYSMDDVGDNFGVTGNTVNGQVDESVVILGVNLSF